MVAERCAEVNFGLPLTAEPRAFSLKAWDREHNRQPTTDNQLSSGGMPSTPPIALQPLDPRLAARVDHECDACIEALWKRSSGLALRISPLAPGVIERPGRTRFDLRLTGANLRIDGPMLAHAPELPILDHTLGLVVLDRLGALGPESFKLLLSECTRVLSEDGQLQVIDINPWGWVGLKARSRGLRCTAGALRIGRLLRHSGLEELSIEHRLWWPPLPPGILDRWSDGLGALGRRTWPGLGSIYAVAGRKRGSSGISIPLGRGAQRPGVMAAAGSMRRAG